jgi:hypothetical protein
MSSRDPNPFSLARDAMDAGLPVRITIDRGSEDSASGIASGEDPSLDLGAHSGSGGGSVVIGEWDSSEAVPIIAGAGVLLLIGGVVLFRLGATKEAMIAGTAGAVLMAAAFYPLLWLAFAVLVLIGVGLWFWNAYRKSVTLDTLGEVVTAVDRDPVVLPHVKQAMAANTRRGKAIVKQARAKAMKKQGVV